MCTRAGSWVNRPAEGQNGQAYGIAAGVFLEKRNIWVAKLHGQPVAEQPIEIVERKGLGHPDSICDAIMEQVSLALTREYERRLGHSLHYNVDKGLLVAGVAEHRLGGGRLVEPMRLVLGDRATFEAEGERLPVREIAIDVAKKWFHDSLPNVDPERDVIYQVEIKPGAPELVSIFHRRNGPLGANDTSAGVGYAPLSETEKMVLGTERFLNSPGFKREFPDTGQDVKVMGFRIGDCLNLTIAMPILDRYVQSETDYFQRKAQIVEALQEHVDRARREISCVNLHYNTLDEPGRGMEGMYLSVLGTSAEDGDSGQVGRGNRVNGVISLSRPAPAEAAAGKNPLSHVGKIYNMLSHRLADKVYREVPGLKEVYVWLCSQIGAPIDRPLVAAGQLVLAPGVRMAGVSRKVEDILDRELAGIGRFTEELKQGKYSVY
ncbi:MAG: methionine adenosyltransferase [Chloroflexi bacterium]|nr:methionine adenosyltransferase [Chloroflexota bacterium]